MVLVMIELDAIKAFGARFSTCSFRSFWASIDSRKSFQRRISRNTGFCDHLPDEPVREYHTRAPVQQFTGELRILDETIYYYAIKRKRERVYP